MVHGEVDKRQVSAIPLPLKTCQVILTLSGSSRGESTLTTRRPQYPECFSVLQQTSHLLGPSSGPLSLPPTSFELLAHSLPSLIDFLHTLIDGRN